MHFDLTKPCSDCPFRKVGGIRLMPERAREIAESFTKEPGLIFPCHKTAHCDNDEYAWEPTGHEQMCAGGLVLAQKGKRPLNQMLRMAVGFGLYDPDRLDRRSFGSVFDSVRAMVRAQRGDG